MPLTAAEIESSTNQPGAPIAAGNLELLTGRSAMGVTGGVALSLAGE
jgi:hypothetical protein